MARLDPETHAAIEENGRRCRKGGDGRSHVIRSAVTTQHRALGRSGHAARASAPRRKSRALQAEFALRQAQAIVRMAVGIQDGLVTNTHCRNIDEAGYVAQNTEAAVEAWNRVEWPVPTESSQANPQRAGEDFRTALDGPGSAPRRFLRIGWGNTARASKGCRDRREANGKRSRSLGRARLNWAQWRWSRIASGAPKVRRRDNRLQQDEAR